MAADVDAAYMIQCIYYVSYFNHFFRVLPCNAPWGKNAHLLLLQNICYGIRTDMATFAIPLSKSRIAKRKIRFRYRS